MAQQISDDVWDRLDARAARLPRTVVRRLRLAIVLLAGLTLGGVLIPRSGAVTPRIEVMPGWAGAFEDGRISDSFVNRYHRRVQDPTHVSQSFTVENAGWSPIEIAGIDADQPGIHVERVLIDEVARAGPYPLRSGATVGIKIFYHVTDCAAVTSAPRSVPVRVRRWFGEQTVLVPLRPLRPYRTGGWIVQESGVQWQRFLADHACGVPYPDGL